MIALADIQPVVDELWARIEAHKAKRGATNGKPTNGKPTNGAAVALPAPGNNDEIIARIRASKDRETFERLMAGDTSGYENDHSRADLAFCKRLAFWFGPDPARIDAIFRQSGLMRPKWDERRGETTYGARTIAEALKKGKFYPWKVNNSASGAGRTASEGRAWPRLDAGCQDLETITAEAWEALQADNSPERLFRFGGIPSRLERDDRGQPVLRVLNEDRMRYEIARAAEWFATRKAGDEGTVEVEAKPPRDVVKDMLATPDPPLPVLRRIVEAPVFAPDGSLQIEPGYHVASRTLYVPAPGFVVPVVPERPDGVEIATARNFLLDELLGDFPFVGAAEKAHAVVMVLQPFVRNQIDGATPLFLIEKPSPGSGATLLVDVVTSIASGRPVSTMTEGTCEEEWRKRLTAKLIGAPEVVFIDNLRRRLDSAALSSAITSGCWEDRILGQTTMARIPVDCIWIASGNNPVVSTEIARRTVRIRLDARQDRPWLRDGWRHPDLRGWARENRGELVWAALTLVRGWLAAGRPKGQTRLGMFESWSEVMGGILSVAGVPGFLGNLAEFYDSADAEGEAQRALLAAWFAKYGEREVMGFDVFALVGVDGVVDLDLGDGSQQSQRIRLGKILRALRDRVFTIATADGPVQFRVSQSGISHHARLWKLARIGS